MTLRCLIVSLGGLFLSTLQADVIINEMGASSDGRLLRWNSDEQPYLGAGRSWWEREFDADQWWTGQGPLGMNRPNLETDVGSFLSGNSPSLYLRKTFPATSSQANSSLRLLLDIDFNDGFVAYLNGKEVARSRMGPVKGFAYADQFAVSERSSDEGPVVYDLGEARDLLDAGENLLAIQVHNESNYGDLFAKATLTFAGASEVYVEHFDSANDDTRTHERDGNSVSNTAQGSPSNGSWLDEAPDPESDNGWSDLVIVTEEDEDIGFQSEGALRYTLTSDDSLEDAAMFSPTFDLGSQWPSGSITSVDLANTTLSLAAFLPEDFEIGVSIAAADGSGPVLEGLQRLSRADTTDLIGYWRFDDSGVSDGDSMNGTVNVLSPGTLDGTRNGSPKYSDDVPGSMIYDPVSNVARANNFSLDCRESFSRLTIPNDAALNTDAFTIEFFIKLIGEPEGFESLARRSTGDGNTISSTRRRWAIAFDHSTTNFGRARQQWDTPGTPPLDYSRVTRGDHIWVDTDSGNGDPYGYGEDDPADEGNGINDDPSWHHVAMSFDSTTNEARFYTDGNPTESLILNGVYLHPDAVLQVGKFGEIYDMLIDEVRYTGRVLRPDEFLTTDPQSTWRNFAINLGEGDASTQDFLDHLNDNNLTDVRLVFNVLESSYDADGKSFAIDDLSLTYNDAGFPASLVGAKESWRYFPGLMEPSGGVYDTAMVQDPLVKNEFSDWVELFNDGNNDIDLSGWTLTDDSSETNKWSFPSGTSIPAGDYLLVLPDGLESLTDPDFLHANFKLSEGGEYLGLFNENGQLQSEISPEYPTQYPTASYGRDSGSGTLGYLELPTPGQANVGSALSDRVDAPDFDVKGGFYDNSVTVTLSSETAGALIRYTQDGTEPDLSNGITYNGPITVTKLSSSSGRMIRARAFLDGQLPSRSKTQTYLIDQDPQLRSAPALVLAADLPRHLYKPFGPLAIDGGTYINDEWVATNDEDYNHALFRGRAFERPLHLEYYFTDGTAGFRTDGGLRIAASNSARPEIVLQHLDESPWRAEKREKPSFNVYFRKEYGNDSVTFPLNGESAVDRFEQLRVRAGKNDGRNPFIIDEWVRRLFVEMGQVGSRGAINSLYVNGEYKGNYNTVERLREPFFNEHYDLPGSTDWDVLQAGNLNQIASGDRVAWGAMLALMNGPISENNWNAVLEAADVVNMADYYLLNIYMGMWDWPNNNWVAARARIPEGRYRFYVWDAEGAINENGDKEVDFDTIEVDLNTRTGDVETCWRALNRWPEFRLLFADRIQKHLFNGGALDDQDFDDSTLNRFYNDLETDFADLLDYRLGQEVDRDALEDWVDSSDGRRNYLLGPRREDFRDNDLWPDTEPVSFNQHGGMVGSGFTVTISHGEGGGSDVYYTLDGTDPRAYGDAVSASALDYPNGGITLPGGVTTILSRVRESDGEWSPLTEATFFSGTEAPTANNLVVAEIHYHPAENINDASIDKDDYEYLQLLNVGDTAVDLTGIRFDEGIDFVFPNSSLAPGDYALLVKNQQTFESRYGSGFSVLGEYGGRLSNGGEQLTLRDADGGILHQFTYADEAPWPSMADGLGRALRLRDPESAPDPNDPASWMASPVYHGTPGGVVPQETFASWQAHHFTTAELGDSSISGPLSDPDGDGLTNLAEYGLGNLPRASASEEIFPIEQLRVESGGDVYLGFTYSIATTAEDLSHVVQVSSDHANWDDSSSDTINVATPVDLGDGRIIYTVRDRVPFSTGQRRFMRIQFTQE